MSNDVDGRRAVAYRLRGLCERMEVEVRELNDSAFVEELIEAVFPDEDMSREEFVWYLAEVIE